MNAAAEWPNEQVLIPDLLRVAPQARAVLDRYGFRGCGGPLGPVESLGFFAKAHEVSIGPLLTELRAGLARPAAAPAPATAAANSGLADAVCRNDMPIPSPWRTSNARHRDSQK
jgi:hypothetical protein